MVKEHILIFDVDRTILKGSTGTLFATRAIKEGVFPFYALFPLLYYLLHYQIGKMKTALFERKFPLLADISQETLDRLARNCFEEKIKPRLYTEAVSIINDAKKEDKTVLLATSSIDIIVKPVAEYLDIDYLATQLEIVDGASTGYFISPPLVGVDKKRQVIAYLKEKSYNVRDCAFFSDSAMDLPLLETVGNPIAVNPDRKLNKIALHRGWKILHF
jgi:HAD superfamily hydrolase (TIGR01490 family)